MMWRRMPRVKFASRWDGNGIGMADSLIAGMVFTNGAILLTKHKKYFERAEGLRLA